MNILLATDLSAASAAVVDTARSLATAMNAATWVLHVAAPDPDFVSYDAGPPSERDMVAGKFHDQHKAVQAIAGDLRNAGLHSTALLIQGASAETILNEAVKLKADLIVLGSHGKSAMKQMLVGSVSEEVLKKADCPVVVVPTR